MINIVRNRDTKIVYAVVGEGNLVITEGTTTYDGDIFTIDSEFPYTWEFGYECVQAEVEVPEEWHGSKYIFDNGTWTLVV
jgi:hypothetical protein